MHLHGASSLRLFVPECACILKTCGYSDSRMYQIKIPTRVLWSFTHVNLLQVHALCRHTLINYAFISTAFRMANNIHNILTVTNSLLPVPHTLDRPIHKLGRICHSYIAGRSPVGVDADEARLVEGADGCQQ